MCTPDHNHPGLRHRPNSPAYRMTQRYLRDLGYIHTPPPSWEAEHHAAEEATIFRPRPKKEKESLDGSHQPDQT